MNSRKKLSPKVLICMLIIMSFLSLQIGSKLIYITELARHGAKYPSKDIGNFSDPLKGQLTPIGMRQHYLLGTFLHQDYIIGQELTSARFNPKQVEIFYTSYQRTWASAVSQMYGLFPNSNGHKIPDSISEDLLKPPFDIKTSERHLQKELYLTENGEFALDKGYQPIPMREANEILNNCPNFGVLLSNKLKQIAKDLTTFQAQHSLEITKMATVFDLPIYEATVPRMSDLYDNIICTLNLGRELPKGVDEYDVKSLRFISDFYQLSVESGQFGELLSTPLIHKLIQNFEMVIKKETTKKMTLFSAHYENIVELLPILNMTSTECLTKKWKNQTVTELNCVETPDFASSLIFELHEDEEIFSHWIKVKYNGVYANLCEKKSTQCELQEFVQRLKAYVHDDFEKQCGVSTAINEGSQGGLSVLNDIAEEDVQILQN